MQNKAKNKEHSSGLLCNHGDKVIFDLGASCYLVSSSTHWTALPICGSTLNAKQCHRFPKAIHIHIMCYQINMQSWVTCFLTSCIHGCQHDGGDPGYLTVGDGEILLDFFEVDGERLGKGVREADGDEGSEHHGPPPASIGRGVAQVCASWWGHVLLLIPLYKKKKHGFINTLH